MFDFPSEPWQILNLDPATATEEAVKRAYAKLIKLHRPEADPSGFQRAHQAYQQALAQLRGTESSGPAVALAVAPSPTAEFPQVCVAWEARLQTSVAAGDADAVDDCLEEFRPLMKADHSLWQPWGKILASCFVGKTLLLAQCLPAAGAVRLLEAGQPELAQAVLVAWHETRRSEDVLKVARALVARTDLVAEALQAVCVARLATLVSFPSPELGESLANLAFKHLSPGKVRDWIMAQVETRLALGRIFGQLPEENAQFWEQRLTVDADPKAYDWEQREAQRQIYFLCQQAEAGWAGFGILHQFLPPEQWKRIELRMAEPRWNSASQREGQRPRVRRTQQPYQSFSGGGGGRQTGAPIGLAIGAILLVLKLIVAFLMNQ